MLLLIINSVQNIKGERVQRKMDAEGRIATGILPVALVVTCCCYIEFFS